MTNAAPQRLMRGARYRVIRDGCYLRGMKPSGPVSRPFGGETCRSAISSPTRAARSRRATGFRSSTGSTLRVIIWPTNASSSRATGVFGGVFRPRDFWSGPTPRETGGVRANQPFLFSFGGSDLLTVRERGPGRGQKLAGYSERDSP